MAGPATDPTVRAWAAQIGQAAAAGQPLRIRGGGTKDFLDDLPAGPVLDTRSHSGIVDYEPSELVVTARAGTPLIELEAALAQRGQYLPFEPPHFGAGATVGGMVAAGLSGPARASAGAVRDFVLGVHLLNGRGELLEFGGTVMKNVAGYDVARLMAGSRGMLGAITQVSLKVLPQPPAEASLVFEGGQAEALGLLHGWGGRPLPLNASAWLPAPQGAGGEMLVRLRGAVAAVEAACRQMGGEQLDPHAAALLWQDCREQRLPPLQLRAGEALWRLSVPQTAPVLALPAGVRECLVEWQGGLRWLAAAPTAGMAEALQALASAAGGSARLFRLPAEGRPAGADEVPREPALSPALSRIHGRLRQAFDPSGVFNRGRLLQDG